MHLASLAVTFAVAAFVGCGGAETVPTTTTGGPATPVDPATAGTITGTVRFAGTPPTMPTLPLRSIAGCSEQHDGPVYTGDALVHDGLVENAFVYVKDGLAAPSFPVPVEPVTIDQRGCLYTPHVVGALTHQAIRFVNDDAVLHNVHGQPAKSSAWNFGMAVKGSERTVRIDAPEVAVSTRCDVHPWMQAYIGVLDHPYFQVTGPDGRFTLHDVPPGDYVVAAWHERFGTREAKVTLPAKGSTDVTLTFADGPPR
jgi:hypothetical protein